MATITTLPDLLEAVRYYRAQPDFAFDIETMGDDRDNPLVTHVVWLSLATEGCSDVIPMGHPNGALLSSRPKPNKKGMDRMARGVPYEELNPKYDLSVEMELEWGAPPKQLDRGLVMDALKPLFLDPGITKIGHNIKFDIHGMDKYFNHQMVGPFFDTMIASWLFDSRRVKGRNTKSGGLSLEDCVRRELGHRVVKGVGKEIEKHSFDEVAEYARLDAEWTYSLAKALQKKLTPTLQYLMDLEMNTLYPVLEMERNGVLIDTSVLQDIHDETIVEVRDLEQRMNKIVGYDFNPRSNRDKQEALFTPKKDGGQGIRSAKLTPGGIEKRERGEEVTIFDKSVDSDVLEAHSANPLVAALIEYGTLVKLHGTYVLPYLGGVPISGGKYKPSQLRNGRIFGQFKQSGTESGRFSSSNPNLQNIPSRTDAGKRIRSAFIANPGEELVVADYSQIEPRIIASLSGDPTMIQTYRDGGDVYQAVAERMSVNRDAGKKLVLSISYGVGAPKIASDIGCSVDEARELVTYFNRQFPKIAKHKDAVITLAKENQYSETVFGRRRYLDIRSRDAGMRAFSERAAYNHVIQGSAADIMKIALVNIHAALPDEVSLLMTIHDEVVLSSPPELVEEVMEIVASEMATARPRSIKVPLVADVKSGYSWKEAKE